jgi:hypothetical protein
MKAMPSAHALRFVEELLLSTLCVNFIERIITAHHVVAT